MGINPTQANFKSFTFDGENSRNYGVYITGQGVFNAPERNVEMVEIPGRNGAYALDKGTFNNIEVTYPAGIFADTEADFAQAVSDLRNFLCSRVGYVRLEDDYNPNEYRLAIYKSGLDVEHDFLIAGEFELVFECKPQRFLKSGETAISVTSGNSITNPTLFDARPQLQLWGAGNIYINNQRIYLDGGAPIGNIEVSDDIYEHRIKTKEITIDDTYANVGDVLSCRGVIFDNDLFVDSGTISNVSISASGDVDSVWANSYNQFARYKIEIDCFEAFVYGTPLTMTGTATIVITTSAYGDLTATVSASVVYDGAASFTFTFSDTLPTHITEAPNTYSLLLRISPIELYSSQYSVGAPVYIDLDLGEAYKTENGSTVSLNNSVILPAELPVLPSGATTITYDNTFTSVKIVPRWWKV